jgi:arginyl-tRNA synthetase
MTNIFDHFESVAEKGGFGDYWAARAPRRPHRDFDLKLVPRVAGWREHAGALASLRDLAGERWVGAVAQGKDGGVQLRLEDDWVQERGAALEAGAGDQAALADLAQGGRYSVQFCDPNATKALHVGHLRNLALGNALSGALAQAGGLVERRSRISDMGRAMGEAMAGVMESGRQAEGFSDGDEKSDHFVGMCYADYVAAGASVAGTPGAGGFEQAEDSLSREVQVQDDEADELIKGVLRGEREALELWLRTRAWVIAGQRKTLARLGISFDRVLFESDYLLEAAELVEAGLRAGVFRRREDGVIVYETGLRELAEMALVRADGLATQHLRSLTYCLSAPELDRTVSLQVTGSEWVSHVAGIRKLAVELRGDSNGFHPSQSIFHGMVSEQKRALSSSAGALLIDDLIEWIDARIDGDPERREVRGSHPCPERVAAQVALGYFLHHPAAPDIEFAPESLLGAQDSLGWDLVSARAHNRRARANGRRPAALPDYRFAVVQAELYRRYLRLAVQRLDVWPLAHYLKHLARWYVERDRDEHVQRVVHTLLDRSARGLGLGSSP